MNSSNALVDITPTQRRRDSSKPGKSVKANWAALLNWPFDESSDVPLYQQVASFLRDQILDGVIPVGSRLPSSRQLMDRLKVSRTTVITAYSQLHADGYVVCKVGSGTYVADNALDVVQDSGIKQKGRELKHWAPEEGLSKRGRRYLDIDADSMVPENVAFNTGMVRMDGRASAQWQQIVRRMLAVEPTHQGYYPPQGGIEIRQAITRYLNVARNVRCTPEQVILVSGSQQAIDLTIKVLLDPGDAVWIEEPGYSPTRLALEVAGMVLRPIEVDDEGIRVHDGIVKHREARAAFVTPSHQYPLGVQLSMRRRVELLEWAVATNAWVIEDDYDSEFRYNGPSLPALKGLDVNDRAIYVGSFSKVLLPAMRYGYMVVPPALVKAFTAARFLTDRHSPVFFERVLAEFIARGYFVDNIRRMRAEYASARDVLVDMLKAQLDHILDVITPNQGLHLIAYLRNNDLPDTLVAQEAARAGVRVRAISQLYSGGSPRSGLMLGFSGLSESVMQTAVNRLASVLERLSRERPMR